MDCYKELSECDMAVDISSSICTERWDGETADMSAVIEEEKAAGKKKNHFNLCQSR